MADMFDHEGPHVLAPATRATLLTPDDATDLSLNSRALYVGVSGNLKVTTVGGDTVLFTAIPAGMVLPVRVKRVFATLTTADKIISLT